MKLRLYRNSLRLRLTPADVHQLQQTGMTAETTRIAPGVELAYCLRASDTGKDFRATFEGGRLCIEAPTEATRIWAESDIVALKASQDVGDGSTLEILIEKDFQCLETEAQSAEVFYPNPNQVCR